MEKDEVSIAFDLILEEIQAVEDQLNEEGSSAFKGSRYDEANQLSARGKKLREFREKLEGLQNEWNSGIDAVTRERVRVQVQSGYQIPPHRKGPKTNLRITLGNGRVIQRSTAAYAMVDVIDSMDADLVKALGFQVNGIPLIGTDPHPKYGQTPLGRYLVCTHSSTKSKKALLERVAKELGYQIKVEVINYH